MRVHHLPESPIAGCAPCGVSSIPLRLLSSQRAASCFGMVCFGLPGYRRVCHAGTSRSSSPRSWMLRCSRDVRLKRSFGKGCPSGHRTCSSRRSSKARWAQASSGRTLASGSYSRRAARSAVTSGPALLRSTAPQERAGTPGQEKPRYRGFIARTWLLEGEPRTLTISTIWSTPFSPGKSGRPRSISARTQPIDHRSTEEV
mmetsp:Transcript_68154/g.210678  ORF Transcript_68154/g.210678 Transcript_68154/m.210678 type:complete len:201 (-) Transcript_68154:942-1544(-)